MPGKLEKFMRKSLKALGIKLEPRPFRLSQQREYSAYAIGAWTYGHPRIYAWDEGARLHIGNFCSMADGVVIMLGGEHRTEWVSTYPFSAIFPGAQQFTGHPKSKGDVHIGNDVWIGYEALILSGVSIADGAVIAARSVVTQDVPPYAIVAGNPARLVRYRFTPDQIASLLSIHWWDWPLDKIKDNWDLILAADIDAFIKKHSK